MILTASSVLAKMCRNGPTRPTSSGLTYLNKKIIFRICNWISVSNERVLGIRWHILYLYLYIYIYIYIYIFFHGAAAPSGPGPPHYRSFMITIRHNTLGRIPLGEWSARRRDVYLTTHNTHNRQTSMPPVGFESTVPASARPHTHALEGSSIGIGM